MDKMDFAILDSLLNSNSITKISAISLKTMLTKLKISYSTLHRRITKLISRGYIEKGIMESSGNTYFINKKGEKILEEVMQWKIK